MTNNEAVIRKEDFDGMTRSQGIPFLNFRNNQHIQITNPRPTPTEWIPSQEYLHIPGSG